MNTKCPTRINLSSVRQFIEHAKKKHLKSAKQRKVRSLARSHIIRKISYTFISPRNLKVNLNRTREFHRAWVA